MDQETPNVLAECERLSDAELIRAVKFLADRTRHGEFRLLAHIAEFDARRLCLEEGYRSAYEYCTATLGFDEQEAYKRIRVARLMRGFPEVYSALERRKVSMSALVVLSAWLQKDNVASWLKAAEGKSKREIEAIVAAQYPQAAQPDFVRNLPVQSMIVGSAPPQALEVGEPSSVTIFGENAALPVGDSNTAGSLPVDGGPPQVLPITADRVRVGFDAAAALAQMIERLRQLLRHKYPEGRLEDLIREAVSDYLDRKDPDRKLEFKSRKSSPATLPAGFSEESGSRLPVSHLRAYAAGRYIPAKVKSAVWARDKGCCAWRNKDGSLCGSKDWIEYDHITPYARGGRSDDVRNLRLVCRQHNQAAALAAGFSVGPAPGV